MKVASLAEVKANFNAYVRASAKEPILVTRNGRPVAVVLPVADQEDLERLLMAHSPKLQAILAAAKKRIRAGKGLPNEQFWAEVQRDQAKHAKRQKKTG